MSFGPTVRLRKIGELTWVAEPTLQRIREVFRKTGDIVQPTLNRGRPSLLNVIDATVCFRIEMLRVIDIHGMIQFLEGCIERQLDLALEELRLELLHACNIDTTTATISRTLRRRGFT